VVCVSGRFGWKGGADHRVRRSRVTSQTAAVRPTRSSLHSEPLAGRSSHASRPTPCCWSRPKGVAPSAWLFSMESSSDAGHDLDASSLGIAEETPLAGIVPVQRTHPRDCCSGWRRRSRHSPSPQGRHGKAAALPLLEKRGVTRSAWLRLGGQSCRRVHRTGGAGNRNRKRGGREHRIQQRKRRTLQVFDDRRERRSGGVRSRCAADACPGIAPDRRRSITTELLCQLVQAAPDRPLSARQSRCFQSSRSPLALQQLL